MMPPDDPPKLPKWAFLLGDGTLLATAVWIAAKASHPTAGAALVAIVACVALAAICGAIPFLTEYGSQQEASLVERQRALSALAQTVETCAEQISIAAGSLQRFSDLAASRAEPAQESARPVRAQIAELQSQLLKAREGEREKLAQLEAASAATAAAVEQATAMLATRIESAAALLEAKVAAVAAAVATLQGEATSPPEAPRAAPNPIAKVVPFENPAPTPVIAFAPAPEPKLSPPSEARTEAPPVPHRPAGPVAADASAPPSGEINSPPAETAAAPPPRKRAARKPPATTTVTTPTATTMPPAELPMEAAAAPAKDAPRDSAVAGPAPADLAPPPPAPGDGAPPLPAAPAGSLPKSEESAPSTDGATRLLVTAYIGIGNRLFVRGEGPGLSWERGVPLQFVSIGKWRWETAEATAPVIFQLYKNDEVECTALGRCSLAPGRQREFQATF